MTSLPPKIKINTSPFSKLLDDDHKWGCELRFVNTPKYCAKFLILTNQELSSLHKHQDKTETFFVLCGSVQLTIIGNSIMRLDAGESFTVHPSQLHQFRAITETAVILEASTHHKDSDTYRVG